MWWILWQLCSISRYGTSSGSYLSGIVQLIDIARALEYCFSLFMTNIETDVMFFRFFVKSDDSIKKMEFNNVFTLKRSVG